MSKLSFTLDSLKIQTHDLIVDPNWLIVTKETDPAHPEAQPTAEKIYNHLEMKGDQVVLKLPKKWGLSVAEDEAIREMAGERDKVILELRELMEQICVETGVTADEAQNMIFNPWGHQNNKAVYDRTPKIVKLIQKLQATDTRKAEVTAIINSRKIDNWDESDTLALNVQLFESLYSYIESDRNGWVEPEAEGNSLLKDSEKSLPKAKAEKQKALAGTKST